MKKDLTEIVVILDESGSMSSCKNDTIGGFNEFVSTQSKLKGEANVTLVKFSDYYKVINDGVPLKHVALLNESNYTPSNSTALLDAVGKTINSIGKRLSETPENERPEKVIFVVLTDGEENSSKEFNRKKITEMVTHQKDKYQWEFMFLGAGIDAWGAEIGIMNNANVFKDDMSRSFKGLSYYTANYRSGSSERGIANFAMTSADLDVKLAELSDEDKKAVTDKEVK